MERNSAIDPRSHGFMLALLLGLPVAVWLDLSTLSDAALRRQAGSQFSDHEHTRLLRHQCRRPGAGIAGIHAGRA